MLNSMNKKQMEIFKTNLLHSIVVTVLFFSSFIQKNEKHKNFFFLFTFRLMIQISLHFLSFCLVAD